MRLFEFERRWLLEVFDAILPSAQGRRLPLGARDVPLSGFVDELVRFAPLDVILGVRVCLWLVVLCPLFVIGKARTFITLSLQERHAVLAALRQSSIYLVREIPLLFKMLGCLGFCGAPEVQARIGLEPRDQVGPSWMPAETRGAE